MTKTEQIIKNTLNAILESLKDELNKIKDKKEVYFWDICNDEIDANTPQDNKTALGLIEETDLLQYADSGLIDNSSLNRQLVTSAYCCLQQALMDKDIMQDLQEKLNNETISRKRAKEIINLIREYQEQEGFLKPQNKVKYEDTRTQVYLKASFDLKADDFKPFIEKGFLNEKQLIGLSNGVKILTSNKSINQNAMVLENKKKGLIRFYLMDINEGLDIRNFFKLECISKETGFILSPGAYIEQKTKQYEQDKLSLKKNYLTSFKDKEQFLKHMVKISQRLTTLSIKEA
jgi:hypothetical protein